MKTKKFWNWTKNEDTQTRILHLNGTIAEESWFDDDVTPKIFQDELNIGNGDITVWINSPGGDCVAAAQIYNMLKDYKGNVTVKIDGIAASAASVIAMAGTNVLMSPVSMLMIHNPATAAFGDTAEMEKAIEMLNEVKESIINAYELKTGMSRAKLSHLMDAETWMDAYKAVEFGFADDILFSDKSDEEDKTVESDPEEGNDETLSFKKKPAAAMLFSQKNVNTALVNKLVKHCKTEAAQKLTENTVNGRSVDLLMERLNLIKKYI